MAAKLDDNLDEDQEIELQTKELTQVWDFGPLNAQHFSIMSGIAILI